MSSNGKVLATTGLKPTAESVTAYHVKDHIRSFIRNLHRRRLKVIKVASDDMIGSQIRNLQKLGPTGNRHHLGSATLR